MQSTNGYLRAPRNQNEKEILVPDQIKRDGLLLTAWQRIVGGFKCRPLPRSAWDESFRADFPYMAFKPVVHPIRLALLQAIQSGDKELINTTLENARAFCRELEADFASLIPTAEDESVTQVALDETQCQSEAEPLEMAYVAHPSPMSADRAVLPLERHYEKLGKLIRRLRANARSTSTSALVPLR